MEILGLQNRHNRESKIFDDLGDCDDCDDQMETKLKPSKVLNRILNAWIFW